MSFNLEQGPLHLNQLSSGTQTVSTLHSGKATLVTWTFNFPDDLSFNLPLTKHQLAVIGKKYVWDCQIFDI